MRQQCRNLCLTDLYFLIRYGLRRPDIEKQWLLDRCIEVQNDPDGRLDLWAREHYKSTIITFGLTIQNILQSHSTTDASGIPDWSTQPENTYLNPASDGSEKTFCILSHNRPTAKAFLRQIKNELEQNELLKGWFPDVLFADPRKQSPKWSEDEGIVVKRNSNPREATVEAYGLVDGMPTGRHYSGLVYDDVVTEKSVTTADMIRKTTDMFYLSMNLGSEGGFKRYIGTRYDADDTYQSIIDRNVAIQRIHPGTDNGEAGGNPVLFSAAYLDEKKLQGSYIFSCQILQNPIPNIDSFFDMQCVKRFKLKEAPKDLTKYLCSDYAVTEDGDWTVHIIFGIDSTEDIWVLDLWRDRVRSDIWVDAALDLCALHRPALWFEEKGVIQKSVEPFLLRRMRERRIYIKRDGIAADRNKPARARSMQGRVQMGMLHIPLDTGWCDDLMIEMKRFPHTTVDDQVDTLSIMGLACDRIYGPLDLEDLDRPAFNEGRAVLDSIRDQMNGKLGRYA